MRKILDNLIDNFHLAEKMYHTKQHLLQEHRNLLVSYREQAFTSIKNELLEKLPKEKLIQEGIHIFIDNIAFNDCLSQITKTIKECEE